jgi:hypothetical protein
MANSPILGLRLLSTDSIDRESVMNEAIIGFEALTNRTVISSTRTNPTTPAPIDGDVYIVPSTGAVGDWAAHENEIAYYLTGWRYFAPNIGWTFYDLAASNYKKWSGSSWDVVPASAVVVLNDLIDVAISGLSTNDVLKYNGAQWVNGSSPAPTINFDSLSDVVISGPSLGQIPVYTGSAWVNATVAYNINDLLDVTVATPSLNDVLKYNGAQWVNAPVVAIVNEIKDIGDVDDTGRAVNDVLMWSGSAWTASSVGIQVSFANMLEAPAGSFNANPNKVPVVDNTGTVFQWYSFSFLGLLDTPDNYSGQALRTVRVNAAGTALEFYDLAISNAFKDPAKVATTANITLLGPQTIDTVPVSTNDRVLVKNQTNAAENGVYVVQAGAWLRALDMNSSAEFVPSMTVPIESGALGGDKLWMLTTNGPIVMDTTALSFSSIGGGASVFTSLADAPSSYSGQANKLVKVNGAATGLGFIDHLLTSQSDFPSSYVGQSLKSIRVNAAETAVEFFTPQAPYTNENAMDAIANSIAAGTHTGILVSYNDAGDALSFSTEGQQPFLIPFFFDSTPVANELLLDFLVALDCTFSSNWAGSIGAITSLPSATFVMDVRKNGVSVGSISVSTAGVFTFTGTANFTSGDRVQIYAPPTPDVSAARATVTLKGKR